MAEQQLSITCGHCGEGVYAKITAGIPNVGYVAWLECPKCGDGSVRTLSGAVFPAAPAGAHVKNLPGDVEQAWREVRTAHSVAAYTAAEMMCRKILMHVAVDAAGAAPGKSFVEYVNVLEAGGYFAPGLKPVIDTVRNRGNAANHELPASTEDDSKTTMAITEHLLQGIYELPGLLGAPVIPPVAP